MSKTRDEFLKIVDLLESNNLKESQISNYLDQIVDYLSEDENQTIELLETVNENQAYWLVTTFEELAFTFQSEEFINAIEALGQKFPNIEDIDQYISQAKSVMDDVEI